MKLITFSISGILILFGAIIEISGIKIECPSIVLPENDGTHLLGDTAITMLGADNLKFQLSLELDQLWMLLSTERQLQLFHPKIRAELDIKQRGGLGFGLLFELARKITSDHMYCDYTMHAYSINPTQFNSRLFSVTLKDKKDYCIKFYDEIIINEVGNCLMHHLNSLDIQEVHEFEEPEDM